MGPYYDEQSGQWISRDRGEGYRWGLAYLITAAFFFVPFLYVLH
ncbi:hypothetical protein ACFP1Z_28110 [Streptomyces gamaensis]|uniref:Uncharacterized protein n=1 Tax=Streptomyces gamaensis TaxID=1763542 RepID=A0ABW0ZAM6_9ACTN